MPGEPPVRDRSTLELEPGSGAAARPKCPDPGLVIPGGRTGQTGRQGRDVTPPRFVGHGWRECGDRGRFNGCLKFELAGHLLTGNGMPQSPDWPLFFTSSSSLLYLFFISSLPSSFPPSFSFPLVFFSLSFLPFLYPSVVGPSPSLLDSISDVLTRMH